MAWKVKRAQASPKTRLNVPGGVAYDGDQVVLPRRNLQLPDGRILRYVGVWGVPNYVDSVAFVTPDKLWVGAGIEIIDRELGALLAVSVMRKRRDPSWSEICGVKHVLYGPDRDAMMLMPQETFYVHGHEDNPDTHIFNLKTMPPAWADHFWPVAEDLRQEDA